MKEKRVQMGKQKVKKNDTIEVNHISGHVKLKWSKCLN